MLSYTNREGYNLRKYSVNPGAESIYLKSIGREKRIEFFQKNLNSYVNHVLEDNVVSLPYFYRLSPDNDITIYPSGAKVHLDQRERGGGYILGLTTALRQSVETPNTVISLYSPPGPTSFDHDPDNPYTEVGSYHDGQLYLMYFDGKKIHNVAVSISERGENFVRRVLGNIYLEAQNKPTEEEKIFHLITNPKSTQLTIDQFLDFYQRFNLDEVIYRNNKGHEFTLWETLASLRSSFSGQLETSIKANINHQKLTNGEYSGKEIFLAYKSLIINYMSKKGLKSLKLGGSCGSDQKFSFEEMINHYENHLNNLSSLDRFLKQNLSKEVLISSDGEERYDDYQCPGCGKTYSGELKNSDSKTWVKSCQCGHKFNC